MLNVASWLEQKGKSTDIALVGIDLAKNVFAAHGEFRAPTTPGRAHR